MKIFLSSLDKGYEAVVREAFGFLGTSAKVSRGDRVAIKPNLTFPEFRRGVMTTPEAVEAVIRYVKEFTDNITICESDSGGYNAFSMDEVFERTGLKEIAKRYGVAIVNMSYVKSRPITFSRLGRQISVPLPILLLDETDLFITMPVPKVHANTVMSVALKNQWGVIQRPELRLKLHPLFKEVIYYINRALPRSVAIVDGRYGLTASGPMRGEVLDLNWLAAGDNFFAVDYLMTKLMRLDRRKIPYLRWIFGKEKLRSLDGVEFNTDYRAFVTDGFYLKRQWTDMPGLLTFNSRTLAYLGYRSPLAKPLHWLLYKFREPFYDADAYRRSEP